MPHTLLASRSAALPALRRAYRWHRPLMALTAVSVVLLVVSSTGLLVDGRVLTGDPIWLKPAKFCVSIAVYAVTLAWLVSLLERGRRVASAVGTITAVGLAGELAAIVTQVVRGRTSHFDFETLLDAAIYQVMAVLIGLVWLSALAVVVLLLLQRLPDRTLARSLRLGMVIALLGMSVAFLMTLPTAAQQDSWQQGQAVTVVGAHTVGLPDGGPGLPLVGWSTVGGDLRIPHFFGLHGLQVMIAVWLLVTVLGRRWAPLAQEAVRVRVVVVVATTYLALVAVMTWQALRGQSIVHPDAATVAVSAAVLLVAVLAGIGVLVSGGPSGGSRVSGPLRPAASGPGSRA